MSIDDAAIKNTGVIASAPELFVCRPAFIQGMLDARAGKRHSDTHTRVADGMLYTHGRQLAVIIAADGIEVKDAGDLQKAYSNAIKVKDII